MHQLHAQKFLTTQSMGAAEAVSDDPLLWSIISDLACSMVLMEIPMSEAMLLNTQCITAAMTMVSVLWSELCVKLKEQVRHFVQYVELAAEQINRQAHPIK